MTFSPNSGDAGHPLGAGQILAAEVGDLVPVDLRSTRRAAHRHTLVPHGGGEVRLED